MYQVIQVNPAINGFCRVDRRRGKGEGKSEGRNDPREITPVR